MKQDLRIGVVRLLNRHYMSAHELKTELKCTHEQIYEVILYLESIGAVRFVPALKPQERAWAINA